MEEAQTTGIKLDIHERQLLLEGQPDVAKDKSHVTEGIPNKEECDNDNFESEVPLSGDEDHATAKGSSSMNGSHYGEVSDVMSPGQLTLYEMK